MIGYFCKHTSQLVKVDTLNVATVKVDLGMSYSAGMIFHVRTFIVANMVN